VILSFPPRDGSRRDYDPRVLLRRLGLHDVSPPLTALTPIPDEARIACLRFASARLAPSA